MSNPDSLDRHAGFHELAHTADWELEVWAPSITELFAQAAIGMYSLCGMRLDESPRHIRQLELNAGDVESLLVRWLTELLYFGEHENLGFDGFDLEVSERKLTAQLTGGRIVSLGKEIKAVTYHHLKISHEASEYRVQIVFDV